MKGGRSPVDDRFATSRRRHARLAELDGGGYGREFDRWRWRCRMACSPACVAPLLSGQTKSGTDAWPDFGPTIAGNGPQCDEWIDNRLHYVRDVSFGEDASQIRSGAAPQVMAALRN